jgi:hypothetical protein
VAPPLGVLERRGEAALARAGGARVAVAEAADAAPDRGARHVVRADAEVPARERVADPHVAVEVRQRPHARRVRLVALDDHGEPEAELAQPHRRGVHVHPEHRPREQLAPGLRGGARVSERGGERAMRSSAWTRNAPEPARRVEHAHAPEPRAQGVARRAGHASPRSAAGGLRRRGRRRRARSRAPRGDALHERLRV